MFQNPRTTFAQLVQSAFNARTQDTDQCGENKDTSQGDNECNAAETPALITAHCTGVKGAHERFPRRFEETHALDTFRRNTRK